MFISLQGNRLGKRGRSSLFEALEPVPVPSALPFKRSSLKDPTKKRPWKVLSHLAFPHLLSSLAAWLLASQKIDGCHTMTMNITS